MPASRRSGRISSAIPTLPADERTPAHWFNTAAFATANQFSLGSASRNPVRGPSYRDVDLALMRRIPVNANHAIEVRAEIFNLLNTVNLVRPAATAGRLELRHDHQRARSARRAVRCQVSVLGRTWRPVSAGPTCVECRSADQLAGARHNFVIFSRYPSGRNPPTDYNSRLSCAFGRHDRCHLRCGISSPSVTTRSRSR